MRKVQESRALTVNFEPSIKLNRGGLMVASQVGPEELHFIAEASGYPSMEFDEVEYLGVKNDNLVYKTVGYDNIEGGWIVAKVYINNKVGVDFTGSPEGGFFDNVSDAMASFNRLR